MKLLVSRILTFITLFTIAIEASQLDLERLQKIDTVITKAIEEKNTPGAVILVGCNNQIYKKVFGYTSAAHTKEVTTDTIFDLASLTKIFTATSILILAEQGLLRLTAPVSAYIPEFDKNDEGKVLPERAKITLEHLLLHTSGLPSSNNLKDYSQGPEAALHKIYATTLECPCGAKFTYSDLNYIILGKIAEKVSQKKLNEFIDENILKPLGMHNTFFLPPEIVKALIAPTEERDSILLQGDVHDPRARLLGGIAGHAGLFSTVDDLALFCKMILNGGTLGNARILSKLGTACMLKAHTIPEGKLRGLGWDMCTEYSSCKGDFFPLDTICHTGFTGTSIVIDPQSKVFVILLTNRIHLKGNIVNLRAFVANIVASSLV